MTRYVHATPPDCAARDHEVAGQDVPQALAHVLAQFDNERYADASQLTAELPDGNTNESALLFPLACGAVHVVGGTDLAEKIRDLLRGNISHWRLHELPDTTTPLRALQSRLDVRYYNLLFRIGFSRVEEITAIPDDGFLRLPGAGPKALIAIRAATEPPEEPNPAITLTAPAEQAPERHRHLPARLQGAAARRYPELVGALACSSIPVAALNQIADALNDEPLPPADPAVLRLLTAAEEQHLLDHYQATHRPAE